MKKKYFILLAMFTICSMAWTQVPTSYGNLNQGNAGNGGDETNSYFGYEAGLSTTGDRNTFIGYWSGGNNTSGSHNTFVGDRSGSQNTTGTTNTSLGKFSGYSNVAGSNNTFLGFESGYSFSNVNVSNNVAVGRSSGGYNDGDSNVFIGNLSGYTGMGPGFVSTRNSNTFVGYRSGYNDNITTGSGNVFLGYQVGYNESGSNLLYIDNSDTDTPLIYGNFSTDRIGINENNPAYTLDVGGNIGATTFYGSGSGLTSLNATNLSTGTVNNSRLDTDLQDLADGTLSASRVQYGSYFITSAGSSGQIWRSDGSGQGAWSTNGSSLTSLNASNLSSGTVNNSRLDADLQDLADGTLSASRVQHNAYFITSAGVNGQVWQSDGSGQGVWANLNSTFATDAELAALNINDADASQTNEINTGLTLNGTAIEITDSNGTLSQELNGTFATDAELAALNINDADASQTNEINTGLTLNGTAIEITDSNGTLSQELNGTFATDAELSAANALKADLASPSFTGTVIVEDLQLGKGRSMYLGNNEFLHTRQGVALGVEALSDVTASGKFNTAIGTSALQDNTSGDNNTALGHNALTINKTGDGNVALGYNTGPITNNLNNTIAIGNGAAVTGDNAIAIGEAAVADGSSAITIGNGALATGTNSIAIGESAMNTNSNEMTLGNVSIAHIRANVMGFSMLSDGQFKSNIRENIAGLEFIKKLRPVSYRLERGQIHKFLTGKNAPNTIQSELSIGFIAQEVEQVIEESGYVFTGLKRPKNDKDHYGLRYVEFVVPLTKAVQELNAEDEAQQQEIETLQQLVSSQQQEIKTLKDIVYGNTGTSEVVAKSFTNGFVLYQNVPNPFDKTTTIEAVVPENVNQAKIVVYNLQGLELESYAINERGNVSVEISGGHFPSGMYLYALLADGQIIDTKKMILTR